MLPSIHGEFRVGSDPELRFSPSGVAVCHVRVVATKRRQNQQTNEWEDANTCWVTATAFKVQAENMAESIASGMLVVIDGQLEVQEFEDRAGVKRTSPNILVNSIGPSLTRDIAQVKRRETSQQGGGGQQGQPPAQGGSWPAQQPAGDPWASSGQGGGNGPSEGSDEPPF